MCTIKLIQRVSIGMLFMVLSISAYAISGNDYLKPSQGSTLMQSLVQDESESGAIHHQETSHSEASDQEKTEAGGEHHMSTAALLFIILALIIGAGTRHFLKRLPFPFTVLLLIIGLGLGVLARLGYLDTWHLFGHAMNVSFLSESLQWAGHINPHMLLFIFLPILIFEAAFSMDVHVFKKTVANATILAVPGIIIAMVLTGVMMYYTSAFGIGIKGWANWALVMMFGAVVSATDPVAVVALLKELGASKKLGTLIDGESLLNDGTAIVLFMVFYAPLVGEASGLHPVLDFFKVSFGGILVGLVIGNIALAWIKRVFADALVEISVVVAAAYLTFYLCEHAFHVSGVIGLVTLGLIIGGVGRTRISPQVQHFMHEFWEMAGFIANSMIFLIVGLVIAQRTVFSASDFVVLIILYIGVAIIRGLMLTMLFPIMKRIGYGLSGKDAMVAWYGALRGAIALALALIVNSMPNESLVSGFGVSEEIAQSIKDDFLFLTAGLVTLTLLINATTIKALINKLGLTKLEPAKLQMIRNAESYLAKSSANQLNRLKADRYLRKADWYEVEHFMPKVDIAVDDDKIQVEELAEIRRRILEKEKSSYWHQFKDGLLGSEAVQILSSSIDDLMDAGGKLPMSHRNDLEDQWDTPKFLVRLMKIPVVGYIAENKFAERVMKSYDCAVSFIIAQEECLKLVESMHRGGEPETILTLVEEEINENRLHGQTYVRNLRKNFPHIYKEIATRQAARVLLNYENQTIERLLRKGRISADEASRMQDSLKARIKHLKYNPPKLKHKEIVEDEEPLIKD